MKQRFFKCGRCGQVINVVKDTNLVMTCCMADMLELIPNTSDGAAEKHVPHIKKDGQKVVVCVEHPMTAEHYIQWFCLQTKNGCYRIHLEPTDKPEAHFCICENEEIEAAYAFCNLHDLWRKRMR